MTLSSDHPTQSPHGLTTDGTRAENGLNNGRKTGRYGLASNSRSAHTRAANGLLTDWLRTGYGLHTDETRTSYGQNTDGPRSGVRVGSWILVFGKRRAGEIATLRLYHNVGALEENLAHRIPRGASGLIRRGHLSRLFFSGLLPILQGL